MYRITRRLSRGCLGRHGCRQMATPAPLNAATIAVAVANTAARSTHRHRGGGETSALAHAEVDPRMIEPRPLAARKDGVLRRSRRRREAAAVPAAAALAAGGAGGQQATLAQSLSSSSLSPPLPLPPVSCRGTTCSLWGGGGRALPLRPPGRFGVSRRGGGRGGGGGGLGTAPAMWRKRRCRRRFSAVRRLAGAGPLPRGRATARGCQCKGAHSTAGLQRVAARMAGLELARSSLPLGGIALGGGERQREHRIGGGHPVSAGGKMGLKRPIFRYFPLHRIGGGHPKGLKGLCSAQHRSPWGLRVTQQLSSASAETLETLVC